MALIFSLDNIIKFFIHIPHFYINVFTVQSAMMNLKGLVYLVGICLTYILTFTKPSSRMMEEELVVDGLEHLIESIHYGMPGHTDNAMPDYCSVFEGPYFNSSLVQLLHLH